MFPKPKPVLVPNTYAYESEPMVKATGFREYDARWLFGKEINLMGIQALGMGLGALISELGVSQEVVTGHDFRGYWASIKYALISGLLASGCKVHDIGLCMTPMAYFAQFELDVPCVAMVTASHNDNGWTGVKMGANRPLTFGPDRPDMALFLFTKAILEGVPIRLFNHGKMRRDFTHIDDVSRIVLRLIDHIPVVAGSVPARIYNIGNQHPEDLMQVVALLEKALGRTAVKNMLPMQPGDVTETFADVADLMRDTGLKPETSIEDGIVDFVAWYRDYYKV